MGLNIFFYEQKVKHWFQWDIVYWKPIEQPETPDGHYTGIGTRNLNEAGAQAIYDLYGSN